MELDVARLSIRLDRERETFQRLQATYRRKFDSSLLSQSRKDVAGWLDESTAPTSIRQHLQRLHEWHDKIDDIMRTKLINLFGMSTKEVKFATIFEFGVVNISIVKKDRDFRKCFSYLRFRLLILWIEFN